MKIERFSHFDGMYQALGSYSLAVVSEAKRLMFISGLGGMDADGKLAEDFEGQARLVFKNMETILKGVGGSLANVVMIRYYLANVKDITILRKVREEFYKADFPAGTSIGAVMVEPALLLEVDAVAVLD